MQAVYIIVCVILCALLAQRRGRNPFVWGLLGLFMNIFALLLLVILPDLTLQPSEPEQAGQPPQEPDVIDVTPQDSPPAAGVSGAEWYYVDPQHQQQGPYSVDDLRGLWKSGTLKEATYLWSEGMEDWQRLASLPDLRRLLQ